MPPGWPDQGVTLSWGRIYLPIFLLVLTGAVRVDGSGEETPILLSRATTLLRTAGGSTATLHCRIGRQGSHTVSWIRQGDLEILSVGSLLVSTNPRLGVHFDPRVNDHMLTIRQVSVKDEGAYECQLNTMPSRSLVVHLQVEERPGRVKEERQSRKGENLKRREEGKEEAITIVGAPDMQVSSGSLANLTCIVRGAPATPSRVFWYKDGAVLGYYSDRGTSVVRTMRPNMVASSLLIPNFSLADQGTYICRPEHTATKFALARLILKTSGGGYSGTSSSQYRNLPPPQPLTYLLVALASRNCISPFFLLQ